MTLAIDISNNNNVVDLSYCKPAGVDVVVIKATEGIHFHDDFYYANLLQAHNNGLIVGAYDFARPSQCTGGAEARAFLMGTNDGHGLQFVALDMEDDRVSPAADLAAFALDWYEHVHEVFKGPTYLYTSHGYARPHNLENHLDLGVFRLWLASWSITEPLSLAGWSRLGAWQFTAEGYTPGVGQVDQSIWLDVF
jgi:GH25 family lysozyme M1 (1,4-beta-N-acetylmuramidase)